MDGRRAALPPSGRLDQVPSSRVARVAHDQDDLITRRQAIAAGMSKPAIRYAIGSGGRWQVVLPGVYATFTGPLGELHRLRAAVLYGGDGAMVSGAAACRLQGLKYVTPNGNTIDVLVPHRRQRTDSQFVRLRRTHRLPVPMYWVDTDIEDRDELTDMMLDRRSDDADPLANGARRCEIPLAPAPRAALDAVCFRRLELAGNHDGPLPDSVERQLTRDTRALLCEVVQRRHTTTDDLIAELATAPRAGTATARRAMDDILAGCRSAPECELRDLVKTSRVLPEPRWNRPLPGHPAIRPDACWPEARLVVEVNSVEWHRIGPTQELTEKRQALYAELGWRVIAVSPYRLRTQPADVLRQVERAYRQQQRSFR